MGQDAELGGLAGRVRRIGWQCHFKNAVVHIAKAQPEFGSHGCHELAEVQDGRALMRGHLGVTYRRQRHHALQALQHRCLLCQAVVYPQQSRDIRELTIRQRLATRVALHGCCHTRLCLCSLLRKYLERTERGLGRRCDQRIQCWFLQGLRPGGQTGACQTQHQGGGNEGQRRLAKWLHKGFLLGSW